MVAIRSISWLEEHLRDPSVRIVDARPPVKYLSGHVPLAVNLPLSRVLDLNSLELRSQVPIADALSVSGISREKTVIIYDSYDGQSAAMLAWTIEYLGHSNVSILSEYFDAWASGGHETLYKPVRAVREHFEPRPNQAFRVHASDLTGRSCVKLLDLRSRDEFQGRVATESRSGRLPGAVNLPWTSLLGQGTSFLKPKDQLEDVLSKAGIGHADSVVTYCSYGPRGAIGYVGLQQAGYNNVRLYDGSFHQWAKNPNLPVEGEGLQIQL